MNTALAWRLGAPALVVVAITYFDTPERGTVRAGLELRTPEYTLPTNSGMVALGRSLFEDADLSVNRNLSCKSCHDPERAFAAPAPGVVVRGSVVQGSVPGRFGTRRPPSVAYATLLPIHSPGFGTGGAFWDGRASGRMLGNPAADHALSSFLDPSEQAMPDAACVVFRVRGSGYLRDYVSVWGSEVLRIEFPDDTESVCSTPVHRPGDYVGLGENDRLRVERAYRNVALSIMAFEASAIVNRFSSRYDERNLTPLQQQGAQLFNGRARCAECHPPNLLFSDARFHNVGTPRNPASPAFGYETTAFDPGLGGLTGKAGDLGRFRTPTLRNVAVGSRTFMHNGVFTSVKQVIDFYNTRDVLPTCTAEQVAALDPAEYGSYDPDGPGPLAAGSCWPAPETPHNVNTRQIGNLGLTEGQIEAIVAFLGALRDL